MGFLPLRPHHLANAPVPGQLQTRGFLQAILLLGIILLLPGCSPRAAPDLLEIHRIHPKTLEAGSQVRITGAGFPDRRPGTLTLNGTLYTPAREPRELTWSLPVVADSSSTISVAVDTHSLVGQLEGAHHATFRGEAVVRFAPVVEGRPVLRGKKDGLVVDLFSSSQPTEPETNQFLDYLGIKLDESLTIREMMTDSRAKASGLHLGDRLHALDGVRLDAPSDFLPQAHAHASVIEYSRQGFNGRAQAHVDREDFQLLDHNLAAKGLAALSAAVLALLWAARPPQFLIWLFSAKNAPRKGRVLWLNGLSARAQLLAYPVFLGVVLFYFWMLKGLSASFADFDFLVSLTSGSILLLIAAFVLGGVRSHGGFSLLGALSATGLRIFLLVPVFVAALSHAGDMGTLRLVELATAQSPAPPHWGLFHSPWTFLLGLSFLLSLIPLAGRRAPLEGHSAPPSSSLTLSRTIEGAGHLILLGLWISLFAGAAQGPTALWLSGAVFSSKLALLGHGIGWIRARTGGLRLGETWSLFGTSNVVLSLFAAGVGIGSLALGVQETHMDLLGFFAATLAGSLAVLFLIGSQRSWTHMGRRIDPWI